MKFPVSARLLPLGSLSALIFSSTLCQLHAETYYWDNNGNALNFGATSGNWGAPTLGDATQGWSTDVTGTALPASVTTTLSDTVNFGSWYPVSLTTGTVNVVGSVAVGNIRNGLTTGNVILSGGNINLAPAATIYTQSTVTATTVLSGAATSLTKAGSGVLTLNAAAENAFTGGLRLTGGTLNANFANLGTPTNLINSSVGLTISGGSLVVIGQATGTTSQTLNGVTVGNSGGRVVVNSSGGTTNLALGAITANTSGGSLLVGRTTTTGTVNITSTTDKDATGTYGGRLVWAAGSAAGANSHNWVTSTGAGPYTLGAYTGYTTMVTTGGDAATNYRMTVLTSLTSSFAINSLKMEAPTGGLQLDTNTLTLNNGGLLSTGTTGRTISSAIGGKLTAGSGGGYDLIIHQYNSGGLTIGANLEISDNGANAVKLVKEGTGILINNSTVNTYSGGTMLGGGVLQIASASSLGTGGLTLANNAVRLVVNNDVNYAGNITINSAAGVAGRGLLENSAAGGNATLSGEITIHDIPASGGHFSSVGTGSLTVTGEINSSAAVLHRQGTLILSGGGSYENFVHYVGTVRLGADNGFATNGTMLISALGGGPSTANFDLAGFNQQLVGMTKGPNAAIIGNSSTTSNSTLTTTGTSEYAGVIQNVVDSGTRTVALTINGGALTLSGTNTYTGATTISAGTLALADTGSINGTSVLALGGGTFNVSAKPAATRSAT